MKNTHQTPKHISRAAYSYHPDFATSIDQLISDHGKKILYVHCLDEINIRSIRHILLDQLYKITKDFVLVTDIDDSCVPFDEEYQLLNVEEFEKIYNHSNLKAWYTINLALPNGKPKCIHHLPLGLDYHTIEKSDFWGMPKTSAIEQEKQIRHLHLSSKPIDARIFKCLVSFDGNDNERFKHYGLISNNRSDILNALHHNRNVEFVRPRVPRLQLWDTFSDYAFTIAPTGHGLDTHRIWEALILGLIVIKEKSPLDDLYDGLPVVILDNFNGITESLMEEWFDRYSPLCQNLDTRNKYFTHYWVSRMLSHID